MPGRKKVFVSYSHKDKKWLERLQVFLKPLQDEGLIDLWDDTQIRSGEKWNAEIREALAAARAAILLVSADFLASEYIVEEELPSILAAAENKGVVILPVIVSPSRFKKSGLSRFQSVNAPDRPLTKLRKWEQEEILVKLTDDVEAALGRTTARTIPGGTRSVTEARAVREPALHKRNLWTVPQERNFFFEGRKEELQHVYERLTTRGRAMLSGLGGTGKTQIAVEYAHRHRDFYDDVLWVSAKTPLELGTSYTRLAQDDMLRLPARHQSDQQVIVEAVKRWMETNEGWLLTFDGANDPNLLQPFLPRDSSGHILITSRSHHGQTLGIVKPITVKELIPPEALAFLLKRTGRNDAGAEERAAAKTLAEELDCLPLALEQAAAYVSQQEAPFQDYLTSFKTRRLTLVDESRPILGNYPESVATTWTLNVEEVETTPAAADLLRASSFLAPDDIPLELFVRGAAHLTDALSETLTDTDRNPLALSNVLQPLRRYSLVRRDVAAGTLNINGLVQEVIRNSLDENSRRTWTERLVEAMSEALPPSEYAYREEWTLFAPHIHQIAEWGRNWDLMTEAMGCLLNKLGVHLSHRGAYAEAEPLYERALEIREEVLGDEHADTAASLNNLGYLHVRRGRYAEAEPLFKRALEIWQEMLGEEHPSTATSLNNLGYLHVRRGRYAEAEPLYERALEIREEVLGKEHPSTVRSLNNLGRLYVSQGRYAEAKPLFERALEFREEVLGEEHPDTAASLNNLAGLYESQGRYAEAEPLYERALEIREEVLGKEHPSTATSLNNLGYLHVRRGRYAEAEPLYERALEIWEEVFVGGHPSTARSLYNLGYLFVSQGQYAEAEPLFERALKIREEVLGEEHTDTKIVRDSLRDLRSRK